MAYLDEAGLEYFYNKLKTNHLDQIATNTAAIEDLFGLITNDTTQLTSTIEAYYAFKRTGKVYQVKFPLYSTATTTAGEKLLDNAGLVCVPSTDTVEGQDDYADIPLFQWVNVNYIREADGSPIPTAIEGQSSYATTGAVDVGVMQMSFWWKRETVDGYEYWTVSDSPHPELGLIPWYECVKADGTVMPWCIGSKYMAGKGSDNKPRSLPGLDLWNRNMSYSTAITNFQTKGAGYWGAGMEAGLFNLLFLVIKYATKNGQSVMYGYCNHYSAYGYVALAETDATRILLAANNTTFFEGGYIQSGTSTVASRDRNQADCYNVCDHAKILSIEQVEVNGTTYTALNIDKTVTTVLGGVVASTPYNAGATDTVLGHHDGSPVSNTNGHYPYRLQGREQFVGVWCLASNVALNTIASHLDQEMWVAARGVSHTSNTTTIQSDYELVTTVIGNDGSHFWIGDIDVYEEDGLWVPVSIGQSNSTGWCDYKYTSGGEGWRELLWGGGLSLGLLSGPCAWYAANALTSAHWSFAARD